MKGSRVCQSNICHFGVLIILGWLILTNSRHGISSENQGKITSCKGHFHFFKDFIYLFLETGEGREEERERNFGWPPPIGEHRSGIESGRESIQARNQ